MKTETLKRPNLKAIAKDIYWNNYGVKRSIVVTEMVEFGLTKKGAETYYQNFKSGKWV